MTAPPNPLRPSSKWPRIVDLVFVRRDSRHAFAVRVGVAVAIAVSAHAAIALGARLAEPPLSAWTADMLDEVSRRLAHEQHVDLEPPPPPPPPPPLTQAPPPPKADPPPAAREPPSKPTPSTPPPPAEAGKVVAAAPDAPADLTSDVFVTGSGSAYAGGVTTSSGTNKEAVATGPVGPPDAPPGPPARPPGPDRSKAVALADDDWSCPWPHSAEAEDIDEQAVVIRVVVSVDGNVESANVVTDPGAGFGAAALECARRSRFHPALDHEGRPIRSTSPPIRVRFTR